MSASPVSSSAPAAGLNPLGGLLWAARLSARQFLTGPRKWVILLAGAAFPALLAVFVFLEKGQMLHPYLQLYDQLYVRRIVDRRWPGSRSSCSGLALGAPA